VAGRSAGVDAELRSEVGPLTPRLEKVIHTLDMRLFDVKADVCPIDLLAGL
jgi:hypothetical protein